MHVYEMGVINMLNAEKYKNEILEKSNVVFDFSISKDRHTIEKCLGVCDNCIFCNIGEHCSNVKVKWLLSKYKEPIEVSKLEYDILTYILKNTECRYITRNKSRSLCVHSYKPVKDTQYEQWTAVCDAVCDKVKSCEVFNNLFPFIKWEDSTPTLIKDVLENCEVVEDDSNE